MAIKSIVDSKKQYKNDTTMYGLLLKEASETNIAMKGTNSQLKMKSTSDSLQILVLNNKLSILTNKSDSIKTVLVDNAIKELEEQRKKIEGEKENTFKHLENEIEDNLRKTIINYNKQVIIGFQDTTLFVATKLNNTYIKKYESISQNIFIIDCLMETSEQIDRVNSIADQLKIWIDLNDPKQKSGRHLNIRMFLANVESLQYYLYLLFHRIITLDSYKKFESIELGKSIPDSVKVKINNYILNNSYSIRRF